ncbi:hypothetical protein [Vibrio ishigakensis]|uniref:hypothetical protein n=1 Tax=Vibrio ishigakensis TaxID=1481914 RepID=UPI0021C4A055|nr:hypothetical protein [Vibrio ishigakensis]
MSQGSKLAFKVWAVDMGKFVIVCNLVAILSVVVIESVTGLFGLKYWTDYVFFSLILQWGVATLFFMYPPMGGMGASDDRADRVADSMVDRSLADEVDANRFSDNTVFCIKLILSGLPAFVMCIFVSLYG